MQELLELFGRDQFLKQLFFDFGWNRFGIALNAVAYPLLLLFALNVAALGPDLAAVVFDQHRPDFAQGYFILAAEAVRKEPAIQIPDREAVSLGLELRMLVNRNHVERVYVGDQVAPHAIGVDEFEDARLFFDLLTFAVNARQERVHVNRPAQRLIGDADVGEDFVVKIVFAEQQLVNVGEKQPRFSALNDAVIVGAGDREDLADAELRQGFVGHRGVFGRIFDRARRDDRALTGHQSRGGRRRADRSRVGERNGRALKIADLQFALARAFDHVLISVNELPKAHSVRAFDVRHEQAARAVFLLHVNRHAQIHVLPARAIGHALNLFVAVVHLRVFSQRLDHGPGDEMCVRSLAFALRFKMAIDPAAVFVEQFNLNLTRRGRRGHGETRFHILDDP